MSYVLLELVESLKLCDNSITEDDAVLPVSSTCTAAASPYRHAVDVDLSQSCVPLAHGSEVRQRYVPPAHTTITNRISWSYPLPARYPFQKKSTKNVILPRLLQGPTVDRADKNRARTRRHGAPPKPAVHVTPRCRARRFIRDPAAAPGSLRTPRPPSLALSAVLSRFPRPAPGSRTRRAR